MNVEQAHEIIRKQNVASAIELFAKCERLDREMDATTERLNSIVQRLDAKSLIEYIDATTPKVCGCGDAHDRKTSPCAGMEG